MVDKVNGGGNALKTKSTIYILIGSLISGVFLGFILGVFG
jgi:hypothetical protein